MQNADGRSLSIRVSSPSRWETQTRTGAPRRDASRLVLQKSQRLLEKRAVVLEDSSMSSIRKNAQLRVWQLPRKLHRIDRWHHHVGVAVRHQYRVLDSGQRGWLRRHAPPGNRGHLSNA